MNKAQASARAKKSWATRRKNAAEAERKQSANYHIANTPDEKRAKRSARAVKAAATRKANASHRGKGVKGTRLSETEKLVLAALRRRDLSVEIRFEIVRTIMEGL